MKKTNKAMIFDIQRYSLHDGPGIRTLIFLKGCPLQCLWCCNPESQSMFSEVEFHKDLCVGCNQCMKACQQGAIGDGNPGSYRIDKSKCIHCGACAKACAFNALRIVGKEADASDIFEQIMKDERYYKQSGGGVTLSGGEPLLWIDFCEELLKDCFNRNIHTAIETAGYIPKGYLDRVKEYVDVFLYDIKSMDSNRHKELTGVPNDLILENICKLREDGKHVIMRIPFVPGINIAEDELEKMLAFAENLGIREVNIMPYHNLGQIKYDRLCKPYMLSDLKPLKFAADFEKQMEQFKYILNNHKNIKVTIGG